MGICFQSLANAETFERAELARVDDDTVADDADRGVALEPAVADDASGDEMCIRDSTDIYLDGETKERKCRRLTE